MQSYFNPASWARAKKNRDDLEKTNPQEPVLKDEDEKFLERHLSNDNVVEAAKTGQPTRATDDGKEKPATEEEQEPAAEDDNIVPETQSEAPASQTAPEKKRKKDKGFELPSQEDAEAATRSWDDQVKTDEKGQSAGEKRTWASYIPSIKTSTAKKPDNGEQKSATEGETDQRTWAQYASQYVPSSVSYPSLPKWTRDKDSQPEPVYNEDGTINEEATKEKEEREAATILNSLDMSSINNRVFAFSAETQKFYERFVQVLKDTINGVPTAYEDMDKLMREAGPTLEKQFNSMPPFLQTLVKSLPSKLGTMVGPELVAAAAAEKPDDEMKRRMQTASKGEKFAEAGSSTQTGDAGKKKRKIPGVKSLVNKQGAVAGILRSTVNFLQTRFPFLASTTNVVMSLAVFILMFVFWYCHKRGRETRLANSAADLRDEEKAEGGVDGAEDDDDDIEEDTDEEVGDEEVGDEEAAGEAAAESVAKDLQETLQQPEPAEVPLPEGSKEEKTS